MTAAYAKRPFNEQSWRCQRSGEDNPCGDKTSGGTPAAFLIPASVVFPLRFTVTDSHRDTRKQIQHPIVVFTFRELF